MKVLLLQINVYPVNLEPISIQQPTNVSKEDALLIVMSVQVRLHVLNANLDTLFLLTLITEINLFVPSVFQVAEFALKVNLQHVFNVVMVFICL